MMKYLTILYMIVLASLAIFTSKCQASAFTRGTLNNAKHQQQATATLTKPRPQSTNSHKRITPSNAGHLNFHLLKNSPQNNHVQQQQQDTSTTTTSTHENIAKTSDTDTQTQQQQQQQQRALFASSVSVPTIAAVTLSAVAVAAKVGILPGTSAAVPYTNSMILQDTGMALLTGFLGYAFVKVNTWAAAPQQQYLEPRDSRKLIHTFSAPLFMIFWPLFSQHPSARFFAASVSFINMIRLFLAGSGSTNDSSLAFAVSRSGDAKEALGGPFLYVVILQFAILLFWRDSPIGIVALSAMAAGDGLADLVGRRFGESNKWPFNSDKSVAGTLAFWVGGTACSLALLQWLHIPLIAASSTALSFVTPELIVTGIIGAAALLELIPGVDDNWVVPLSAAVMTMLFLT